MLHDILDDDHIQWHPPLRRHYTNFWPLLIRTLLTILTFYLIVQGFHRTYATGAHVNRGRLLLRTLVLSHFGTCTCSNVETNLSWSCVASGLLNYENPLVLLFCFHACTQSEVRYGRLKIIHFYDLDTHLDLLCITRGFHGAFATMTHASMERLPSRTPISANCWHLHICSWFRPFFTKLPCFSRFFHFDYPSLLSRFCILKSKKQVSLSEIIALFNCNNVRYYKNNYFFWYMYRVKYFKIIICISYNR